MPSPHLILSIQADCPPYSKAQACPVPKVRYQDQVSMASAMLHCGPILLYSQELVQLQSDDLVSMSGRGVEVVRFYRGSSQAGVPTLSRPNGKDWKDYQVDCITYPFTRFMHASLHGESVIYY